MPPGSDTLPPNVPPLQTTVLLPLWSENPLLPCTPAYAIPRGKKYVLLLQDAGSAWDVDAYPAPPAMLHPLSAFPAHLELSLIHI